MYIPRTVIMLIVVVEIGCGGSPRLCGTSVCSIVSIAFIFGDDRTTSRYVYTPRIVVYCGGIRNGLVGVYEYP